MGQQCRLVAGRLLQRGDLRVEPVDRPIEAVLRCGNKASLAIEGLAEQAVHLLVESLAHNDGTEVASLGAADLKLQSKGRAGARYRQLLAVPRSRLTIDRTHHVRARSRQGVGANARARGPRRHVGDHGKALATAVPAGLQLQITVVGQRRQPRHTRLLQGGVDGIDDLTQRAAGGQRDHHGTGSRADGQALGLRNTAAGYRAAGHDGGLGCQLTDRYGVGTSLHTAARRDELDIAATGRARLAEEPQHRLVVAVERCTQGARIEGNGAAAGQTQANGAQGVVRAAGTHAEARSRDQVQQLRSQSLHRSAAQQRPAGARLGIICGQLVDGPHGLVEGRGKTLHRRDKGRIAGRDLQGSATARLQVQGHTGNGPRDRIAGTGHRQPVDAETGILRSLAQGHPPRCPRAVAELCERARGAAHRDRESVVHSGPGPSQGEAIAAAVVDDCRVHAEIGLIDGAGDPVQGIVTAVDDDIADRTTADLNLQRTRTHGGVTGTGETRRVDTLGLSKNDIAKAVGAQLGPVGDGGRGYSSVGKADAAIIAATQILQCPKRRLQTGQAALQGPPGAKARLVRLLLFLQEGNGLLIGRTQIADETLDVDTTDQPRQGHRHDHTSLGFLTHQRPRKDALSGLRHFHHLLCRYVIFVKYLFGYGIAQF